LDRLPIMRISPILVLVAFPSFVLACGNPPENGNTTWAEGASQDGTSSDSQDSVSTQTETPGDGDGDGDPGDGDGDGGFKFDTIVELDAALDCSCEGVGAFDYLWVADTAAHELSKLDTNTMQEVARYVTRPDGIGDPSRTSVSVDGRAVAVANRHGGVTKVWANVEDCEDQNGVPGIQTSSSKDDVLAWGEDECVAWHNPSEPWTTNRPVAWAAGEFNDETCVWEQQAVWTAGCPGGISFPSQAFGQDPNSYVHLLDGETGETLEAITVNGYSCYAWGPYGGAVDPDDNFWFTINGQQGLIKVDRESFTYELFPPPPFNAYGITVDSVGRPWVRTYSQTGVARLDPDTQTWEFAATDGGQGGLAQGPEGRIWTLTTSGVVAFDSETLEILDQFDSNCGFGGKGVSVDGAGRIWLAGGNSAVRFDAETGVSDCYMGYSSAYTYSDMTGFGVANAAGCAPVG
jgi:hypothetical protein